MGAKWLWLGVWACVAGCATVKSPQGGEKDAQPPKLVSTNPPSETRQFQGRRIVFTFDEFLRPGLQPGDVFLSPRPEKAFDAYVQNRQLIVRLPEVLAPDQTYVLTLAQTLKDNAEGNSLASSITYAFSTGSGLDSFSVAGQVLDLMRGKPREKVLVGLYDSDSVSVKGYADLSPRYIAQTDANGVFRLSYLAAGRYRLLGFLDIDASYRWDGPSESVALDDLDEIVLDAGNPAELRNLYLSTLDTLPPTLLRYRVLNANNFRIDFSEPLIGGHIRYGDYLRRWPDSTGQTPYFRDTTNSLHLSLPRPLPRDSFSVEFQVTDTLGNLRDTVLQIGPPDTSLVDELDLSLSQPAGKPYERTLYFSDKVSSDSLLAHVTLVDTVGPDSLFPLQVTNEGVTPTLLFPSTLRAGNSYLLTFDSLLTSTGGYRLPGQKIYLIQIPEERSYGTLYGLVQSPTEQLLVQLLQRERVVRESRGTAYRFVYLPPGEYMLRVVEDADGNGRWTPGALFPTKRIPEPVIVYPDKINLRGGWENKLNLTYPPR